VPASALSIIELQEMNASSLREHCSYAEELGQVTDGRRSAQPHHVVGVHPQPPPPLPALRVSLPRLPPAQDLSCPFLSTIFASYAAYNEMLPLVAASRRKQPNNN
jgi:hypothetical protein